MANVDTSNFGEHLQFMYDAEARWRDENWRTTISEHSSDIDQMLSIIETFDKWIDCLPSENEAKNLLGREIYTDANLSIHLACFGLYKASYMSLRSQLETAMRLIYFLDHPREFNLWHAGDIQWIKELLAGSDVWGREYKYFKLFPGINRFEQDGAAPKELWLIRGNSNLREIYHQLSRHVHSGGPYLQTRGSLAPSYSFDDFSKWHGAFLTVQKHINMLFALCFPEYFAEMDPTDRDIIFDRAIGRENEAYILAACEI